MTYCIHCHAAESRYTLPGATFAVCSDTCLLAYLFSIVEAMTEEEAHQRLAELRAKVAPGGDGRRGGLISEEADMLQMLCQRLGQRVEWEHFDLKSFEVKEGRGS